VVSIVPDSPLFCKILVEIEKEMQSKAKARLATKMYSSTLRGANGAFNAGMRSFLNF
jgi:hypothetical protein